MSRLRIQSLRPEDLQAWSRCAPNPTLRKACLNELKALFHSGASSPGLLWWAREDDNILARLLLVREVDGLSTGLLELPWGGAWRGLLRRVLDRVFYILERQGFPQLEIGEEALSGQAAPLAELERELLAQGFVPAAPRAWAQLRRTRTAPAAVGAELPAGAELDGDDGGVWRVTVLPLPDELATGLAALAAHGARKLRLEWPGNPAELRDPPGVDWQLEESRVHRAWVRRLSATKPAEPGETTASGPEPA